MSAETKMAGAANAGPEAETETINANQSTAPGGGPRRVYESVRGDNLFKRRGIYQARFMGFVETKDDGRVWGLVRRSTGERHRRAAEKKLERWKREAQQEKEGVREPEHRDADRVTIGDLLDAVVTAAEGKKSERTTRCQIQHPKRLLGHVLAARLRKADAEQYRQRRLAAGAKPKTIDNELALVRHAFNLAFENERIKKVPPFPTKLVRGHANARTGFFTPEEFESFNSRVEDPALQDVLGFLFYTGMRVGEMASLVWPNVSDGEIRLAHDDAKTGEGRTVQIRGPLVAIIRRRIAARRFGTAFVFHREGESFETVNGGLPNWCYTLWKHALKAAGLPASRRPHDLRRSFAKNMTAAGVAQQTVMKIGGWKTQSTFNRYLIVDDRDVEQAYARYGERFEQKAAAELTPRVTP